MPRPIHIIGNSEELGRHWPKVRRKIGSVVKLVRRFLDLGNVSITVSRAKRPATIKDLGGIGASCPAEGKIEIVLDPQHPAFRRHPAEAVERPLIHELHHAARRRSGVRIDRSSLLECLWSEGLADHFVYQVTGNLPRWSKKMADELQAGVRAKLSGRIGEKISATDYDLYFLKGSKKEKIPRWSGYAIGLALVRGFLQDNPRKSLIGLTKEPVRKVLGRKDIRRFFGG